jgi:phosphoserine phosphatase RsbU/P
MARISDEENGTMAGITDPYLREQLENRRNELKTAISVVPADETRTTGAPLLELLHEVDAAVERMHEGTYGLCEACEGTVEKDRLIADPLTHLCLDCLSVEEQRALERDLSLAASIQRGLLPQTDVRFREWRLHYRYKPAGVVSGDYCDIIFPSAQDDKLIFLLGDVSGKGVAASLLMTHLHAMFRTLAGIGLDLDKLLEMANRLFGESTTAGQYATLICGRLGHDGEIEIASAGHSPALLVSKDGVKHLGATGLPLGMFSASRYTVHRTRLDLDDCLILYTDGISEANGASGNEYGISALSTAAGERYGWAPNELVHSCWEAVEKHSAGVRQADDQTLMAIQRTAGATAAASFAD